MSQNGPQQNEQQEQVFNTVDGDEDDEDNGVAQSLLLAATRGGGGDGEAHRQPMRNTSALMPHSTSCIAISTSQSFTCANPAVDGADGDVISGTDQNQGVMDDVGATLSLLQIDDEYDAAGGSGTDGHTRQAIYRHYIPHTVAGPSPSSSKKGRRRSSDVDVGGLADVAQSDAASASPRQDHQRWEDGASPSGTAASDAMDTLMQQMRSNSSSVDWVMDDEEAETYARLQKALRDQQRLRQEELMELQKIYAKAMRKTFRSLRGMPEPSFDAPTALYEEELDAQQQEHDEEEWERGDGNGGDTVRPSEPAPITAAKGNMAYHPYRRATIPSLGSSCSAEPTADATTTADEHRQSTPRHQQSSSYHADCLDETSVMDSALRANAAAASSVAMVAPAPRVEGSTYLPGGTHIHTTTGGGTSYRGGGGGGGEGSNGGVLGANGFVSRLRRRTIDEGLSTDEFGGWTPSSSSGGRPASE